MISRPYFCLSHCWRMTLLPLLMKELSRKLYWKNDPLLTVIDGKHLTACSSQFSLKPQEKTWPKKSVEQRTVLAKIIQKGKSHNKHTKHTRCQWQRLFPLYAWTKQQCKNMLNMHKLECIQLIWSLCKHKNVPASWWKHQRRPLD